jgi:hypothetical protein
MDRIKGNVHSISLMAKAPLLIMIRVKNQNLMVFGLPDAFLMALLSIRTEIPLRGCSGKAGYIRERLPLRMAVTFLRAKRPDASISRH